MASSVRWPQRLAEEISAAATILYWRDVRKFHINCRGRKRGEDGGREKKRMSQMHTIFGGSNVMAV